MPEVILAPYLPLRKEASVGPARLVPFRRLDDLEYSSPEIEGDIRLLVQAYAVAGGLGAVVVPVGLPVGSEGLRDALGPLHRAILLGVLEVNPQPGDLNAGHKRASTENALMYGHPLRGDGTFATHTGFMAPFGAIHGRIRPDDTLTIQPPGDLPTPIMATDFDAEYAGAAYDVMKGHGEASRRLSRCVDWLGVAWHNTASITHDTRILALRTGFDVLLSTDAEGSETREVRTALGLLLGPDDQRRTRTWVNRGKPVSAELTELEWWFQSFALLRNAIAHGHTIAEADRRFDDGRWQLLKGEEVLRNAIRETIVTNGHPEMAERDPLMRTLRQSAVELLRQREEFGTEQADEGDPV